MVAGSTNLVSDAERYQLALQAGFTGQNAVTATAISIAENGSGNPSLPSAQNKNGTFDLGLWQINSDWFSQFGGQQALTNPLTNAQAAFAIFSQHGGFNNWCTFWPTGCGGANANNPTVQANWQQALQRAEAVVGGLGGGTTDTNPPTQANPTTTTNTTTGTQTQAQPTATTGSNPSQPSINLGFTDSIQHSIVQFLLVLVGIAILIGGIYLIGSGKA
jgi:Lysozyme like domain